MQTLLTTDFAQISDMIEQVQNKQMWPDGCMTEIRWFDTTAVETIKPVSMTKHLTCDSLTQWCRDMNVLQKIFSGAGAHVSLVERADCIVTFLEDTVLLAASDHKSVLCSVIWQWRS